MLVGGRVGSRARSSRPHSGFLQYPDTHGAYKPPTHSPAGIWGHTHTHADTLRSSWTHTSYSPSRITPTPVKPFHNNHMLVHKYTYPCVESDTHKTHSTGKSDSHKHMHWCTPDTPCSWSHASTPKGEKGPDHATLARMGDKKEAPSEEGKLEHPRKFASRPIHTITCTHLYTSQPCPAYPRVSDVISNCRDHLQPWIQGLSPLSCLLQWEDPGPTRPSLCPILPFTHALKQYSLGSWGHCCEENRLFCPWGIYSLTENEHIKFITGGLDLLWEVP